MEVAPGRNPTVDPHIPALVGERTGAVRERAGGFGEFANTEWVHRRS